MFSFFVCTKKWAWGLPSKVLFKAFVHPKSKYSITKHGNIAKIRRFYHRLQFNNAGDVKLTSSTRDWFGKWKVTKCFLNRDWEPGMVCALNYTRLDVGALWCSYAQHNKIKGGSKTFNFRSKKIAKASEKRPQKARAICLYELKRSAFLKGWWESYSLLDVTHYCAPQTTKHVSLRSSISISLFWSTCKHRKFQAKHRCLSIVVFSNLRPKCWTDLINYSINGFFYFIMSASCLNDFYTQSKENPLPAKILSE